MFKTIIKSTPLVNDDANNFFRNIHGESFFGDVSFVSTLRALVAPRMKTDDNLQLRFGKSDYTTQHINNVPVKGMVKAICNYFYPGDGGNIYIHNLTSHEQEDNYACLELLKSTFESVYDGWHRLEKFTDFFRKQFYVICFINPELKSVAIFADNMDTRKMHYLQCSIFAFLPWYFNPKEGVSELEMELINSLREKTADKYIEAVSKIATQYDFRAARIRRMLTGFETKFERVEYENTLNRIRGIIDDINYINTQIGEKLTLKNNLDIKLLGLEKKIADGSGDSEIMEYFLCNDKLVLFDVADTTITFGVKSYLTYFDEDMARSAINNENSYVYYPDGVDCSHYISAESMKKLMQAIFVDQTLKIRFCAAYEFRLNGSVKPMYEYDFGHEFNEYMPNIHIDAFQCMGNYERTINELLLNRDYISAIEQCIASSKSLNFGDSVVMNKFMSTLYGFGSHRDYNKCIELPDGRVVKPIDAIKWIEEQESGSNE